MKSNSGLWHFISYQRFIFKEEKALPLFSLKMHIRLPLPLFPLEGLCCYAFWKDVEFFWYSEFLQWLWSHLLAILCCSEGTAWEKQWVGTILALLLPTPTPVPMALQRRQGYYRDKGIWVCIRGQSLSKADLKNIFMLSVQ